MLTSMALGEFELLVLLAASRLDDAYAVSVREEIEARTGRPVPRGSVYITLDRLTRKGYLREHAAARADRGATPKRTFALTGDGKAAVKDALAGLRRMQQGLAWLTRE